MELYHELPLEGSKSVGDSDVWAIHGYLDSLLFEELFDLCHCLRRRHGRLPKGRWHETEQMASLVTWRTGPSQGRL